MQILYNETNILKHTDIEIEMDGSAKMIAQSVQFGAQHPDGNICCSSPAISVKMISFGLGLQL